MYKIKNVRIAYLLMILMFFSMGYLPVFSQQKHVSRSPWEGLKVFQEKGCKQCHSVYGVGGKGGPDLGKKKFYGTYLKLAALMWNHYPRMYNKMKEKGFRFSKLSTTEMSQLIDYLSFIRYRGEPGRESLGRKLLKSKGCISCHKLGGEGGDLGPDISKSMRILSPLILLESMWNHGPHMMKMFQENHIKRPEFKDNEIVDLAIAIRASMAPTNMVPPSAYDIGDPVNGKKLAKEKGCMKCHSMRGVGGSFGPDFYEMDLDYSVTQIAGKMWNHGPRMWEIMEKENIRFPNFKEGEMADIIAYLYQSKMKDAPGNKEEGKKVVEEGRCLSCHNIRGQGAGSLENLAEIGKLESPLAMITAMWNHAPAILKKHREMKLKWPKLNDRDIANLYTYLNGLLPPQKSQ